ncbi:MAG: hypothetical protein KC657_22295 [Myxococcales bacterium]|nr:hypothetical protein [Myxococcales bacterium]
MMAPGTSSASETSHAAGGYGPPGGGYPPPGGGAPPGGYGGPPPGGGAPPGGYGGPPPGGGAPPGGYGGPPPGGGPPGYGGPPAGGFGAPPGYGPQGGFPPPGGPMMPGAGGDVNTTLPLILNIVGLLFCSGTCIGFITSILGIVFAVQGGNAVKAGDVETGRGKAKLSWIMFIVSAALGVILYTIGFIMQLANS